MKVYPFIQFSLNGIFLGKRTNHKKYLKFKELQFFFDVLVLTLLFTNCLLVMFIGFLLTRNVNGELLASKIVTF